MNVPPGSLRLLGCSRIPVRTLLDHFIARENVTGVKQAFRLSLAGVPTTETAESVRNSEERQNRISRSSSKSASRQNPCQKREVSPNALAIVGVFGS